MATFARGTPNGWYQGDDSSATARGTPNNWQQINSTAAAGVATPPFQPRIFQSIVFCNPVVRGAQK